MFTFQLNVYTVAISSATKIVIIEWLRLNKTGFLMGSIMARRMILIIVLSLLLRVYYLMRCTHNPLWGVIMNSFDSTISYFGVSLVFGKICKIWCYWVVCAYLFSTSRILLSLGDLSSLGAEGNSDTNWLPYPVEMLGWLSFIFISHNYVLNKLKTQILYRCFCMLLQ